MEKSMVLRAIEKCTEISRCELVNPDGILKGCEIANMLKNNNFPEYFQVLGIIYPFITSMGDITIEHIFGDLSYKASLKKDLEALKLFRLKRTNLNENMNLFKNSQIVNVAGAITLINLQNERVNRNNIEEILEHVTYVTTSLYPALYSKNSLFAPAIMTELRRLTDDAFNLSEKIIVVK